MNEHIIKILFILSSRVRKDGKPPLYCRITYKKKRRQFATGVFVTPKYWNSKKQKIISKSLDAEKDILNFQLSLISQKISEAFLLLQIQGKDFDVDDIYNQYKGENKDDEKTLLELYDIHNKQTKKLIGIDFNETS